MRGTMLIFRPDAKAPEQVSFHRAATLDDLKRGIGGGYLEVVPAFKTIAVNNVVMDCVAMCDEEGKLKGMPLNEMANTAWFASCRRLSGSPAPLHDYLCGPVIVLFGDRDFMEAL